MPGVESAAVCFHVRTGSRDEAPDIAGVSHFLEHMMFKGTQGGRSAIDISKQFERMGADYNAFTWVESTVYYARVLGDRLPEALDILSDMMRPTLDEGEFTTEKGVIIEEIARSEDQPTHELIHKLFETFFHPHPLGNSVLGTPQTIGAMPVERMREYHAGRYSPDNMVVGVAGNFEWETFLPLLQDRTGSWEPRATGRPGIGFNPSPRSQVEVKPKLQQEHVALASPAPDSASPDSWAAGLLASVLGDSSGSRLFWEVTQKGLADSVETEYYGFDGAGMFLTYFSASPEKAREVLGVVRSELEKLEREGVSPEELERAKVKAVSDTVIGGEASHRRMFEVVELYLSKGRALSVDEIIAAIEAVTPEDIARVARSYPLSAYTLQAAGPMNEAELLG
jgi:predicted Zn-dependent peptidase